MKKLPSKNIQVLAFYGLTAASLFPSDSLLFSKVGNPLLEEYTWIFLEGSFFIFQPQTESLG